ncbi:hypothetical protein MKW92_005156, partial [Papaver armeniacum]
PIQHGDKKLQQKDKGKRNYGKLIIKRTTEKQRKDKLGVFYECITYVQDNLEKIKEYYSEQFAYEDT